MEPQNGGLEDDYSTWQIFRFHVKFQGCIGGEIKNSVDSQSNIYIPETNIFAPENGWLEH